MPGSSKPPLLPLLRELAPALLPLLIGISLTLLFPASEPETVVEPVSSPTAAAATIEESIRADLPRGERAVVRAATPDDPVRIRVRGIDIDLAVYPGRDEARPRCRVAEFSEALGRPRDGDRWTFIYAHGRTGMFGALLKATTARLKESRYEIWTADGRRWEYRLERVIRHSRDVGDLSGLPADAVVLQTCETADGGGPKIYLVLRLVARPGSDLEGANTPLPTPQNCA